MRIGGQLSLLGGAGKGCLFGSNLLSRYIDSHKATTIQEMDVSAKRIATWLNSLSSTQATESSLESKFINEVFCGVLGYTLYPCEQGTPSSIYQKPSSLLTRMARTPDALVGDFDEETLCFTGVVELKTPDTDLDAPQPRTGNETPVEQGFYYGRRILGVRWVILSDMRRIRLYAVESDGEYEEIRLADCVDKTHRPTEMFKRLYFLIHHDYLVKGHENSQVALLYEKSAALQLEVRDSFYQAYYDVRSDLYRAIRAAPSHLDWKPDRRELLEATQRLLDRVVFIQFCEDHPQQLIPRDTVRKVCSSARLLPGEGACKVYQALKSLFREVDTGSPLGNQIQIAGYNGELFKDHPIVDHIDLPDSLHDRQYVVTGSKGRLRRIQGVWGLYEYDFWRELNEHLLGHIFEQSLSDLDDIGTAQARTAAERLKERKKGGIYYTSSILSDFLANSSIQVLLNEIAPLDDSSELDELLRRRLDGLTGLRIADLACGSGAFLVSAYHELLREYSRLRSSIAKLRYSGKTVGPDLFEAADSTDQASLLRSSLYGVDKLPQAVEIAKLALWLASARKGEKVADLGGNIVSADSLAIDDLLERLSLEPGSLDLVIGNPPWGGQVDLHVYEKATGILGIPRDENLDTWELFLLLGLYALREGGRLALVLPDSFFYPDKERTRRRLVDMTTVEKLHYLGPDWFGPNVRMATVILQARRGPADRTADILCSVLAGDLRRQAIQGKVPVTQVEAQIGHEVPMARVLDSPNADFEVFRSKNDDRIMQAMVDGSIELATICDRGRGEEINKAGLLWFCPSCSGITPPGTKAKGGGYNEKKCPVCGYAMREGNVNTGSMIETVPSSCTAPFLDGNDINRRYQRLPAGKWIRLGVQGWSPKPDALYKSPKIMIRQAGVGLVATLDETDAYCPQSVYIYRLKKEYERQGYTHEYLLAALLSRTMAYFIFKRYGEIDPAKAHSKLTHTRLQFLPIPRLDPTSQHNMRTRDDITRSVRKLMDGSGALGGPEDQAIELRLRDLWHVDKIDGAYINGQFYGLDNSQVVRDLFPAGPPKPQGIAVVSE